MASDQPDEPVFSIEVDGIVKVIDLSNLRRYSLEQLSEIIPSLLNHYRKRKVKQLNHGNNPLQDLDELKRKNEDRTHGV